MIVCDVIFFLTAKIGGLQITQIPFVKSLVQSRVLHRELKITTITNADEGKYSPQLMCLYMKFHTNQVLLSEKIPMHVSEQNLMKKN